MIPAFDVDPYPGKPKILFVGLSESSHTHAWISLLSESEINVRLFALPTGVPPADWQVKTYVNQISWQSNTPMREYLHAVPQPGTQEKSIPAPRRKLSTATLKKLIPRALRKLIPETLKKKIVKKFVKEDTTQGEPERPRTSDEWLGSIIRIWKPDIIHTLGLEPASYYYYEVRKTHGLEGIGKWVAQVRGGPDLALNRFLPEYAEKIKAVFQECDQIIADNQQNYEYALAMGLARERVCELGALPGTGGIDVAALKSLWQTPPSHREKIIVWPKAYECPQSKSLPVFEALKLAWSRLPACKILMFAADYETMLWFQTLPEEIRKASCISYRVPRDELLSSLVRARVMLAPSILDGVPNTLYEAMASGAFPIVSPLETITPVVREPENVLFARNLYPAEMAEALVRAMSNDELVDVASTHNYALVRRIANRALIGPKIVDYYHRLSRSEGGH